MGFFVGVEVPPEVVIGEDRALLLLDEGLEEGLLLVVLELRAGEVTV